MNLCVAMLMGILSKQEIQVTFPNLNADIASLLDLECYKALNEINELIDDPSLSDGVVLLKIKNLLYNLQVSGWKEPHRNPPSAEEKDHGSPAESKDLGGTDGKPRRGRPKKQKAP